MTLTLAVVLLVSAIRTSKRKRSRNGESGNANSGDTPVSPNAVYPLKLNSPQLLKKLNTHSNSRERLTLSKDLTNQYTQVQSIPEYRGRILWVRWEKVHQDCIFDQPRAVACSLLSSLDSSFSLQVTTIKHHSDICTTKLFIHSPGMGFHW